MPIFNSSGGGGSMINFYRMRTEKWSFGGNNFGENDIEKLPMFEKMIDNYYF